jgi:hypothetical protein
MGASMNGTLGTHESGRGAVYLADMLRSKSHISVPVSFTNFGAHTCVVTASNAHILDAKGHVCDVKFYDDPEASAKLALAEKAVSAWADTAWKVRTEPLGLKYSLAPTLTKSVVKETESLASTGINDCGYGLVHDILNSYERSKPHSWETTEALLKNAIETHIGDTSLFLEATAKPGLRAAQEAATVASAFSTIACHAISYRADGRSRITVDGQETVAAESWPRVTHRVADSHGDCDDAALYINALASMAIHAPVETLASHPHIRAVRNSLFPHYTVGLGVMSANSPEASEKGGTSSEQGGVAGHASTFLIPTLCFLGALETGSKASVNGGEVASEEHVDAVANARFNAIFSKEVVDGMPLEEQEGLRTWSNVKSQVGGAWALEHLAAEGTTPASPVLYAEGARATEALACAERDRAVCLAVGSTIGRSYKVMHVGGPSATESHQFYKSVVEFDLTRNHPLWLDPCLRSLGAASTQHCMTQKADPQTGIINEAGVSPRDFVLGTYAAVPLVTTDTETGHVLDFASRASDLDVIPSEEHWKMNEFQTARLGESIRHLTSLDDKFKAAAIEAGTDHDAGAHCVAYVMAFNSLVHNPMAVEHFCSRVSAVAVSGVVDIMHIPGLATSDTGEDAGKMVVVHVAV